MGNSSPLVCHSCWDARDNWNESCPHAMEVFRQGERKGVLAGKPIPLDPLELPAVLLEWSSPTSSKHRIVAHAGFGGICGDGENRPQFVMEKRDGRDGTGDEVWLRVKDETGAAELLGAAVLALRNAGVLPVRAIEAAASTDLKTRKQIIECPSCGIECKLAYEPEGGGRKMIVGWTCGNCGIVRHCHRCRGSGRSVAKICGMDVSQVCPDCGGCGIGRELEEGRGR